MSLSTHNDRSHPSMRARLASAAVLPLLFLTACAGPEVSYYGIENEAVPPLGSPVAVDQVTIYVTQKPSVPYTELGILNYNTSAWNPDEAAIYQAFRQKAAAIGADGVILLPSSERIERHPSRRSALFDLSESVRTTYRGVAIRTQ